MMRKVMTGGCLVVAAAFVSACGQAAERRTSPATEPAMHSVEVAERPMMVTALRAAASRQRNAPPFSGVIELQLFRAGVASPVTIRYEVQGKHLRYDEQDPAMHQGVSTALIDLDQHRAYEVDRTAQSYVDVGTLGAINDGGSTRPVQFSAKGTFERLAGLRCENVELKTTQETVEACAVAGIPFITLAPVASGRSAEPAWAAALTRSALFPLRIVDRDAHGEVRFRVEPLRATPECLGRSEFRIPAGYRKLPLSTDTRLPGMA
jgi:hypothetical protein